MPGSPKRSDKQKAAAAVPDTVRRAVERTIQTTLGPAALTRERAQDLADELLRRAEGSAARAGRGVRATRQRQREAAAGMSDRVRDAITELRKMGGDEISELRSEIERLQSRVNALERKVSQGGAARAERGTTAARDAAATRKSKSTSRAPARGTRSRGRRTTS